MKYVEDDILEVVDEENLKTEFRKCREILEAQFYPLPVDQVDQQWIDHHLIYDEVYYCLTTNLSPILAVPRP